MTHAISLSDVHKEYTMLPCLSNGYKRILINMLRGTLFKRDSHKVLQGLTFAVNKGEAVAIVGRNGAGKSTLLGLLCRVLKPTMGEIEICGKVFAMLELGSGFHPALTGRENIIMNGVLLGLHREDVLEKLDDIIAFSELETFIDQPIYTYSSGMLARLGFSVLVHLKPEILLLDEVFAVGDIRFQKKCRDAILQLKATGDTTMLFVSHDSHSIRELCERVIWIEEGKVHADGKTEDILPLFEAVYAG